MKGAFLAACGVCLGVFLWTTLSLSGLKMIFETFALMRILPTLLGMFYLLYLDFLLKNLK
ncbi:LysE family transporter [Helicobacter suis]|uniref:LysE family transporter n=1 Tax=Helicobacter suis TaxID=104628 RepID=UPI0023DD9A30|nr:LysE family transporter [Helicobacter suis]